MEMQGAGGTRAIAPWHCAGQMAPRIRQVRAEKKGMSYMEYKIRF